MAFPTDIDTFTTMNADLPYTLKTEGHNTRHNELNTAVASLEAKVGADSSAVTSSHDYKIAQLEANDTTQDANIALNTARGVDGWVSSGETWTYASVDGPTGTFTISGDKSDKYSAGMRIKLTQTSKKYFIITKVTVSGDTTITVYGGTDYTLANAAITDPYYSNAKAPTGFPMSPNKWCETVTDTTTRTQATPTAGTWYNLGGVTLSVPVGAWKLWYKCQCRINDNDDTPGNIFTTLSTADDSESDKDFTAAFYVQAVGATDATINTMHYLINHVDIATKTSYYLNTNTGFTGVVAIENSNGAIPAIIKAECAYL